MLMISLCFTLGMAQDDAQEESNAAERLKELQRETYPSFINDTPPPQPLPSQIEDTSDIQLPPEKSAEPATVEDEVDPLMMGEFATLTADIASTQTWSVSRKRVFDSIEELRISIFTDATPEQIQIEASEVNAYMKILTDAARFQAPAQRSALQFQQGRLSRQLEFLLEDYRRERWDHLSTTDELIRMTMDEVDYLLYRSDLDRGAPIREYLPRDWNPGTFRDPDFQEMIISWSATRLVQAYKDRIDILDHRVKNRKLSYNSDYTREMGELARELAIRINEVPVSSQTAFRNSALRLDVMAESLQDFMEEGNRPYSRRHIRFLKDAINETEAYLKLRSQGF